MRSMTGFASVDGDLPSEAVAAPARWRWDARSVNNRGLETRLRLPPTWEAWEAGWRAEVASRFKRGSISLTLSVSETAAARPFRVNRDALDLVLSEAKAIRAKLRAEGAPEPTLSIDGMLALRGVLETDAPPASRPSDASADIVTSGLSAVLDGLATARADEGRRLAALLADQIDQIEALTNAADAQASARGDGAKARLRDKVAALLEAGAEVEERRLAQELALLAVKADVREELDRLRSHIVGARDLFASDAPIGRKLDFLTQEFNREANTLCSKAQDAALTEIGLNLKVVIDQLREQASNVE